MASPQCGDVKEHWISGIQPVLFQKSNFEKRENKIRKWLFSPISKHQKHLVGKKFAQSSAESCEKPHFKHYFDVEGKKRKILLKSKTHSSQRRTMPREASFRACMIRHQPRTLEPFSKIIEFIKISKF